jgi:hypothetical protein
LANAAICSTIEGTAAVVVVTDKVAFDVCISRQDGTFYVRDDVPNTPENNVVNVVFQGRIVVGLFGKAVAQYHVTRFRQVVDTVDGGPQLFGRSLFYPVRRRDTPA